VPIVPNVAVADLLQVIKGGSPKAGNQYGTAGKVTHTQSYVNGGTLSGDPAYTFTAGVTNWFGDNSGTLSAAGFTTEASPQDGARECVWLDAAITTLTWHANTGQTMDSRNAAAVAFEPNCVTYQASTQTWHSSP
jgi:hypothetical protein